MEENVSINDKKVNIPKGQEVSTSSIIGFSVLGLLFLLCYSYIELIGWMYMTEGDTTKSLTLMVVCAVVLSVTSFMLPRIKASNRAFISKRRNFYMFITSFIFAVAMLVSFFGVSHFDTVYRNESEIVRLYNAGVAEARELYPNYQKYVEQRVNQYATVLDKAIASKTKDASYNEYVGQFPGVSDKKRKENLIKSLKRTLQPTNDKLHENFNNWLNGVGDANLWNMSFIKNVYVMDSKINNCIEGLTDMSQRYFHPGENQVAFTYTKYSSTSKLQVLMTTVEFGISWKAILALLITAFTLIMPTLRESIRSRKDC